MTDPEPNETTSDAQATTTQECTVSRLRDLSASVSFWWAAYVGTIMAGGVFGALLAMVEGPGAALLGLIPGFVFAGMVAIPIHLTVVIMTWALWMSRIRVVSAGIAGGITGVVATQLIPDGSMDRYVLGAGVIGAMGASAAGAWADRVSRDRTKTPSGNRVWQFTLRDLFLRVTVIAMLLAAWTWAVRSIHDARNRQQSETQLDYAD